MRSLKELPVWAWLIAIAFGAMLLQEFGRQRYIEGFKDGLQNLDTAEADVQFVHPQAGEPIEE